MKSKALRSHDWLILNVIASREEKVQSIATGLDPLKCNRHSASNKPRISGSKPEKGLKIPTKQKHLKSSEKSENASFRNHVQTKSLNEASDKLGCQR